MKIFAHFKTISDNPLKFILWILTSFLLSLSSFWIPVIIDCIIGQNHYSKIMGNNPFVTFSIVFLCNSIFLSINQVGAAANDFAMGMRGISLVLTFIYIILLAAITPLKIFFNITLENFTQYILLVITFLIGVFIYGFREKDWEQSVDDVRKKQEKEVIDIAKKAEKITTDNEITL